MYFTQVIDDFLHNIPITTNCTTKQHLIQYNDDWYLGNKWLTVSQNTGGTSGKYAKIIMTSPRPTYNAWRAAHTLYRRLLPHPQAYIYIYI